MPITSDRCGSANDANWASQVLWGENTWNIFLQGGQLGGILGDPTQTDNLYQLGFARLMAPGCRTQVSVPTPATASP